MPKLRHKIAALFGAIALCSTALLFGAGAAQAQTSYPPGSGTVPCTAGNVTLGTVVVGDTITFTLCGGFTGTSVSITVNGTATTVTKAPVNGAVVVVVTVVSTTVLAIDDPVDVAAVCGTNTVTATGAGSPGTSTGTFNLQCTTSTTQASSASGLALTGADVMGLVIGALVLLGLGTVLVVSMQRRRQDV